MKPVYDSFESFQNDARLVRDQRPVITVGSFDGVHLGHQYLLNELVEWARRQDAPSVAVTFRRHPRTMTTGANVPSLNTPDHKAQLLLDEGIDRVVMVDFDDVLMNVTAERFMRDYVHGYLNARAMLVGFNNRIGKDAEGTVEVLTSLGSDLGVVVREAERVEVSGVAMSSSAIRTHVANGDFLWVRKMLGRPYSIRGRVIQGDQRGRTIGFPTANIDIEGLASPPNGVYSVRVLVDGQEFMGAANIGVRPTVDPMRETPLLEVYLLDFDGDLYGRDIEVVFLYHLRDEQKFASLDALRTQLDHDVEEVRRRNYGRMNHE